MEQKKLGKEPAFPLVNEKGYPLLIDVVSPNYGIEYSVGISKRFYAACAAMQGILSSMDKDQISLVRETSEKFKMRHESVIIKMAYGYADELLKQENE